MRPTLVALFGEDFYQDAEVIKISKASLGLSAQNQRAEVIFVALIIRALQPFEGVITGNGQTLTDENNAPISYSNKQLYDRLLLFFWQRNFFVDKAGNPVARRSYVLELYAQANNETRTISVGEMDD
jgi:hypothetical protein